MNDSLVSRCHVCGEPQLYSGKYVAYTSELYDKVRLSNDPLDEPDDELVRNEVIPHAKASRLEGQNERDRLDALITSLHAERDRLDSEIAGLTNMMDGCRVALSPQRRLPPECLTEIFEWYCDKWEDQVFDTSGGVWVLSHVSQYWRNIVTSLPSLWANLVFADYGSDPYPPNWVSVLMIRIQNTKGHPLFVDFHSNVSDMWRESLEERQCLAILTAYSGQWQDVSLSIGWYLIDRLDVVLGNLPILESLTVVIAGNDDDSDDDEDELETVDAFVEAPLLHTVALDLCGGLRFTFPYAQVRKLTVSSDDKKRAEQAALPFLLHSHCLDWMEINFTHENWDTLNFDIDVPPTALRYLSTTLSPPDKESPFQRQISNPVLEDLELHCGIVEFSDAAIVFLRASRSPQLRRLTLYLGSSVYEKADVTQENSVVNGLQAIFDLVSTLQEVTILLEVVGSNIVATDRNLRELVEMLADQIGASEQSFREKLPQLRIFVVDFWESAERLEQYLD